MFNKKKTKIMEKKAVCPTCGLDCGDKFSLERHIDWVQAVGKNLLKQIRTLHYAKALEGKAIQIGTAAEIIGKDLKGSGQQY